MASSDESSVRVALRIRPPIARELIDDCQLCTTVTPNQPQVWIGGNYAFTYDYVFDVDSSQEAVFESVRSLIDGCLDGYNATILAYGQTGSGKTYTMGTAFEVDTHASENQGIIPRAVNYLFNSIHGRRENALRDNNTPPDFTVTAQFVELYNEEIIDLIDPNIMAKSGRKGPGTIAIREDPTGGIYLVGVGCKAISSAEEAMSCLHKGALSRTTASTNMNDQSSRSHAIFTLHIKQERVVHSTGDEAMDTGTMAEVETLSGKFHFVDLAGSERLKRTGAVGDRAKEGISINSGLLSLGNVISALGDRSKKSIHVPYRDSKLTRLLQDSLGGNSRTVVIACVSPCDRDFLETLNTMKYANRARNIKNKITINQDKSSSIIAHLRAQVQQLELELQEYKQGKRAVTDTGDEIETDTYHENILLHTELTTLKGRIKALQGTINTLTARNTQLLVERETGTWNIKDNREDLDSHSDLTGMVQKYLQEIEELSAKLFESEATCEQLRKRMADGHGHGHGSVAGFNTSGGLNLSPRPAMTAMTTSSAYNDMDTVTDFDADEMPQSVANLLDEAKREVAAEEKELKRLRKLEKRREKIDNNEEDGEEEEESSENEDDDDEDDEDEDEDEEDQTSEATVTNFGIQLAQLTNEIGTKQRLIDQLELSQRRLESMKAQYEEKLRCLSTRIKATQEERDKVLSSMHQQKSTPAGKINQVKDDYEKKLVGMQSELKKWQAAHKEHQRVLRNQGQQERQMQTLRAEVDNMKRVKVKLMNQLKEENLKRREVEAQRNKEIAQLKKSQRKKDIAIRTLETENRMKEQVLKRKHEEVNALKKLGRPNLTSGSGSRRDQNTPGPSASAATSKRFSPVKAKAKWVNLQSELLHTVSIRKTTEILEADMLSHINERSLLKSDLEMLIQEREIKQRQTSSPAVLNHISDQIETVESALHFLDEKINDCQRDMVELEFDATNKKEEDEGAIMRMFHALNKEECAYIMRKMYQQILDELTQSSNATKMVQTIKQENSHLSHENKVLREMLAYRQSASALEDLPPQFAHDLDSLRSCFPAIGLPGSDILMNGPLTRGIHESLGLGHGFGLVASSIGADSRSTPSSPMVKKNLYTNGNGLSRMENDGRDRERERTAIPGPAIPSTKSRRLTASRRDLLDDRRAYLAASNPNQTDHYVNTRSMDDSEGIFVNPNNLPDLSTNFVRAGSLRGSQRLQRRDTYTVADARVKQVLPTLPVNPSISRLNSFGRKPLPREQQLQRQNSMPMTGDLMTGRGNNGQGHGHFTRPAAHDLLNPSLLAPVYVSRSVSVSPRKQQMQNEFNLNTTFLTDERSPDESPPWTPEQMRRSGVGADVFQRLTSSMAPNIETSIQNGYVRQIRDKQPGSHSRSSPLIQTHMADGHTKAVLSIYATEDRLFTGSKDATVKIWDLKAGGEIQTLTGLPSSVSCVRYLEDLRLVLCASVCYIKVWDLRLNPTTCVKTLQSSGISNNGSIYFDPNNRMHQLPSGEHAINDISTSQRSFAMYTPFGDKVRLWDLRNFSSVGLLSGKHTAQVTSLASEDWTGKEVLVTGSKDHTLKVYEFESQEPIMNTAVPPKCAMLDPPHYDGIESLALSGAMLFSGSRDMCIKKWDLDKYNLVTSLNNAHTGWISGLTFAPKNDGLLLSASKDGFVKLWATDTCQVLGKVEAAKGGVHCIASNSTTIFTGGLDGKIGFWSLNKKQVSDTMADRDNSGSSTESTGDNST